MTCDGAVMGVFFIPVDGCIFVAAVVEITLRYY
jgi:hypothetical protein